MVRYVEVAFYMLIVVFIMQFDDGCLVAWNFFVMAVTLEAVRICILGFFKDHRKRFLVFPYIYRQEPREVY